MKSILLIIVFLFSPSIFAQDRLLTARDCAIMIDAKVVIGLQTTITLSWLPNEQAKQYYIYKKELGGYFTGEPVATLDSLTYMWTDNAVKDGKTYEYKIVGNSIGRFSGGAVQYLAVGYKAVSVNAPAYQGGRVLVLVDSTMKQPLKNEIFRYLNDLTREGWAYVIHYVPRAESFDGKKVKDVKLKILEEWNKKRFDYIFLLGRVPVPYSGDIVPDGHTNNHQGAWPADMYYGSMNEAYWTDISINSTTAPDRTKNIPNDGKFDISQLYNNQGQIVITTDASVGRVDFYNITLFEKTETELLRDYLDKDHNFRTGEMNIQNKALIDNNFAASSILGAFAWSGWANFGSVLGKDNVISGDWIKNKNPNNLQDSTYLMAFGDGGGTYISSGGVGASEDFAKNNLNSVFSILFGSYFGDWDVKDNLMRTALASAPSILTCSWSGRPHWYYHHLGLDFPIGYSTKVTMNNTLDYVPMLVMNNGTPTFPEGLLLLAHTSLLGDPTLKVNASPDLSNLASFSATEENGETKLTWDLLKDNMQHKWDVFYSIDLSDRWFKANDEPITTNFYTDDFKYDGKITYLVRELITESNGTESIGVHGILNRYSRGNITTITRDDANSIKNNENVLDLILGPNPASDDISIKFRTTSGTAKIIISDLSGTEIKTFKFNNLGNSENSINWNLTTENGKLANGTYIINLENNNKVVTKKLIIGR